MKYNTFYNIPSMAPLSGLSGLCKKKKNKKENILQRKSAFLEYSNWNKSLKWMCLENTNSMLPTNGKEGDFKNIKNVQFVVCANQTLLILNIFIFHVFLFSLLSMLWTWYRIQWLWMILVLMMWILWWVTWTIKIALRV